MWKAYPPSLTGIAGKQDIKFVDNIQKIKLQFYGIEVIFLYGGYNFPVQNILFVVHMFLKFKRPNFSWPSAGLAWAVGGIVALSVVSGGTAVLITRTAMDEGFNGVMEFNIDHDDGMNLKIDNRQPPPQGAEFEVQPGSEMKTDTEPEAEAEAESVQQSAD